MMFAIQLIVHTLLIQLLLEPFVYPSNTLPVCYRHIEDVHEKINGEKIIFDKFTEFLNLANF